MPSSSREPSKRSPTRFHSTNAVPHRARLPTSIRNRRVRALRCGTPTRSSSCSNGGPFDRPASRGGRLRSSDIHRWALEVEALPQGGLRKAIEYMGPLWRGLARFLEDPRIPLDNNASARASGGPAVGRKNHHASRSSRGTEVAALFYSAIESAKLAGVEPKAYLRAATRATPQGDPIPLPHTLATTAP